MEKAFLTISEAAKYLNLSKARMYKYSSQKRITHYKTMRKVYFKREDLDAFILDPLNIVKAKRKLSIEEVLDES